LITSAKTTGSCKIIDISKLFVSQFNARQQDQESTTSEGFTWLCNSIKSEGLIEPIVVRPISGRYEIIAGTRRFAALKHIGATEAPVVVREMSDNDVRIASLIENIHRVDLTEDEKEQTLRQIYLTTWEEWKPKDWQERDYSTDENKIKLARSYLQRLHNEDTGAVSSSNYPIVKSTRPVTVFPTKEFKTLSGRVGYAVSTQINILRGYGAFSPYKDYVEELPPTIRELVEKAAREKKLREDEKQQLAKVALAHRKKIKHDIKKPKTQKEKIERTVKTFTNKVERKRKAEQHRIQQQTEKLQKQREQPKPIQEPKTVLNAARAREQILDLGNDLFKLLTGQEIQGIDPEINEGFAKNSMAIETMKQLVTFFSDSSDIAAQQHIVIPLNIALTRYRDMLYDASESSKRKENMGNR